MNFVGEVGMGIHSCQIQNQGAGAVVHFRPDQGMEEGPSLPGAALPRFDRAEIDRWKPQTGEVTFGDVPIAWAEKPPVKTPVNFTGGNVSQTAQGLADLMDENSEELYFKICSGMSVKQLAEHFGGIGKKLDEAFQAGTITRQEYEDLNRGLEAYTEGVTQKAEREAATWEVAKQCAQATRAKIEGGASDEEMARYAKEHQEGFQDKIKAFLEEFCQIDRSLLKSLIQRVRSGESLFPEGIKQIYCRENTAGYFKNGYVPFVPAKYP